MSTPSNFEAYTDEQLNAARRELARRQAVTVEQARAARRARRDQAWLLLLAKLRLENPQLAELTEDDLMTVFWEVRWFREEWDD
jgi:hypothetical protein